jgi:hypothetical protein
MVAVTEIAKRLRLSLQQLVLVSATGAGHAISCLWLLHLRPWNSVSSYERPNRATAVHSY